MRLPNSVPLQRAFAVLAWERMIPAFTPLIITALLVFGLLWSGAFAFLPLWGHVTALILCAGLLIVLAARGARRFRFPRRTEALRRIEERSGLKPGVLDMAWARSFASDEDDPLWIASRERLLQSIGSPKAPLPRVSLNDADPFRLRYGALLAVVVAIGLTGGEREGLRASLLPPFPERPAAIIDAWVEPPAYTGLSPIVLRGTGAMRAFVVPEDSELHVRIRNQNGSPAKGVVTFAALNERRRRIGNGTDEAGTKAHILQDSGTLSIHARGVEQEVAFRVRPDNPPRVELAGEPDTSTGAIRVSALTADEYPIESGRLLLTLLPGQKLSRDAPAPDAEVLDRPQEIDLGQLAGPPGTRELEVATEEHPWAGLLVKAELQVTDGRGQTGTSQPFAFTMPARTFYNPLSQAVIEERTKLAIAPGPQLGKTTELFEALVTAPDLFGVEATEHLMLRSTASAVRAANQRDVQDLIDSFWPLAIELEDDGLAFAKARLDAAEQALRQALKDGAGDREIAERIEELRQAMNEYISALAQSGYADAQPQDGSQQLGEADLEDLLRQMEELANQGQRAEAEQLLSQLEALLQSLQLAQGGSGEQEGGQQSGQSAEGSPGSQGGEGQAPGQGALSGTGDLMQRQRELGDQTFSARRGDRSSEGLGAEQRALAEELEGLRQEIPDEAEGAGPSFDDAEEAMRDAARALERGDLGVAQALQEQALNAMREGGNQIAEALGKEGGDGEGESGSESGYDPLGRAVSGKGGQRPEDFGLYDPERIRELIGEIRQRLEDPSLPEAERDYLESLLERF